MIVILLLEQFFPIDRHTRRGGDADAYLSTLHGHQRDADVAVDDDLFADPPGEYKHGHSSVMFVHENKKSLHRAQSAGEGCHSRTNPPALSRV